MKLHFQYVEALLAEAKAHEAFHEADMAGNPNAKALAHANLMVAKQICRDALDARSQHQLLGASALAAERL